MKYVYKRYPVSFVILATTIVLTFMVVACAIFSLYRLLAGTYKENIFVRHNNIIIDEYETMTRTEYEELTQDIIMLPEKPEELNEYESEVNTDNTGVYEDDYLVEDSVMCFATPDSEAYNGYITQYTDLRNRMDIYDTDIQECIMNFTAGKNSLLKDEGTAQAFIEASNKTGLDPIFLLALCGMESGWGTSELHAEKNNPYSIGMIDSNVNGGFTLGDTFQEGIVNGAIQINYEWYEEGYTTLYDMEFGGKVYATDSENWINGIVSIMNSCYSYLTEE